MNEKVWYEMDAMSGLYIVMTGDPDGECEIAEMNGEAIRGIDVERIENIAMALADFERKEYIGEAYRFDEYFEYENGVGDDI